MVSSTDATDDGFPGDGLELVTGAGLDEQPAESGPEVRTLVLGEPAAPQPAEPVEVAEDQLPNEDVYRGDGDQIDLIDGVDPLPEYQPALIDLDEDSIVIDPPETDLAPEPVEVPDTLMAVDDYGDVL